MDSSLNDVGWPLMTMPRDLIDIQNFPSPPRGLI
jgi:hypothetical protein